MKVDIGNKSYLVCFKTRENQSNVDVFPRKKLTTITCHIRTSDKNEIAVGKAIQHYNDNCDCIKGRKLAFTRAITPFKDDGGAITPFKDDSGAITLFKDDRGNVIKELFNKEERQVFWDAYKKECRLVKNSWRLENKKLREEIKHLKKTRPVLTTR